MYRKIAWASSPGHAVGVSILGGGGNKRDPHLVLRGYRDLHRRGPPDLPVEDKIAEAVEDRLSLVELHPLEHMGMGSDDTVRPRVDQLMAMTG